MLVFLGLVVIVGILVMAIQNQDKGYLLAQMKRRMDELEGRVRRLEGPLAVPPKTAEPISVGIPVLPKIEPPAPAPVAQKPPRPPAIFDYRPQKLMSAIDWENFMGVKLFSWLGGFALFLGVAFFVKYSIDHNLIGPLMRVSIGFLIGIGAIIGGLLMRPKGYAATVQTLCAAGISVLYADVFASRSFYDFLTPGTAFPLMALVTIASFFLAVRLDSRYVAILGLVGGFLTPVLLSTGVDRPIALFSYIALLDTGLAAIALRKRWGFLLSMAAAATFVMEAGWTLKFFTPEKAGLAIGIYLFFGLFFFLVSIKAAEDESFHYYADYLPILSMGFAGYMLSFPSLGQRPGVVLTFLLTLSVFIAARALRRESAVMAYGVGGAVCYVLLIAWTVMYLNSSLLLWGLGYFMAFALLHTVYPLLWKRLHRSTTPLVTGFWAPIAGLGLIVIAMLACDLLSFLLWPFVLVLGLLGVAFAWLAGSVLAGVTALGLVMACFAIWLLRLPSAEGLTGMVPLLALFSVVFFAWTLLVGKGKSLFAGNALFSRAGLPGAADAALMPAASAFMPFMLLIMACIHLRLPNPSEVFGLAALLNVLLLALARYRSIEPLVPIALASTSVMETAWLMRHTPLTEPVLPLAWGLGFYALFAAFPFAVRRHTKTMAPWITAALAGFAQWPLLWTSFETIAGQPYRALVPLFLALPALASLLGVMEEKQDPKRLSKMAWFGGVSLAFITLIIPIQFKNEWLTVGWALEGAALLWLYRRVPHPGLQEWGLSLLAISVVRLALNPAVFSYHSRTDVAILNWYLWVYGTGAAAMFISSSWLEGQPHARSVQPWLKAAGALLLFLLLNIEIADFFSTGAVVTFNFSGNLAQDMTYSIAWALFAICLLTAGILNRSKGARYASLALLIATIFKVFLHDLWRLGGLFRVGSIVGLAVILMLVSFLYQKYLSKESAHA